MSTVDYRSINIAELARRGAVIRGARTRGIMTWVDGRDHEIASVSYFVDMTDPERSWLRIACTVTREVGTDRRLIDVSVPIVTTRPGFGGLRYWFLVQGRRKAEVVFVDGGEGTSHGEAAEMRLTREFVS